MSDIWEPWTPEVGQRVRTRMSGECPYRGPRWSDRDTGLTGTVVEILGDTDDVLSGHRFRVQLDDWRFARCAAVELEPVQ